MQGKNDGQQCNQGQHGDLAKQGNSSSAPPVKPSHSQASAKLWCEFHKLTMHSTVDCKEHLACIQELQDMIKASKACVTDGLVDSQPDDSGSFVALSTHGTFSDTHE